MREIIEKVQVKNAYWDKITLECKEEIHRKWLITTSTLRMTFVVVPATQHFITRDIYFSLKTLIFLVNLVAIGGHDTTLGADKGSRIFHENTSAFVLT